MAKARSALARTRAELESGGQPLSQWESEFLDSLQARLDTYGRAFNDPEKGALDAALSVLQALKLKEVQAKARGEAPARPRWGTSRRQATCKPSSPADRDEPDS